MGFSWKLCKGGGGGCAEKYLGGASAPTFNALDNTDHPLLSNLYLWTSILRCYILDTRTGMDNLFRSASQNRLKSMPNFSAYHPTVGILPWKYRWRAKKKGHYSRWCPGHYARWCPIFVPKSGEEQRSKVITSANKKKVIMSANVQLSSPKINRLYGSRAKFGTRARGCPMPIPALWHSLFFPSDNRFISGIAMLSS